MASDDPDVKYLYDIIYCDRTRLTPLISQLFAHGLPKDIAVTKETGSSGSIEAGGTAGWNFGPTAKAGGKVAVDIDERSGMTTTHDPYWSTVLNFVDQAASLAKRESFEVGKLCLVKGSLRLVDFNSMRKIFEIKWFSKLALSELKSETPGNSKAKDKEAREVWESVERLMEIYSNSVQGVVTGRDGDYWASFEREHLIFPAEEIVLKYGRQVSGTWTVIGIYDARPENKDVEDDELNSPNLMLNFQGMMDPLRNLVGRPANHHSLTPLVVMREI